MKRLIEYLRNSNTAISQRTRWEIAVLELRLKLGEEVSKLAHCVGIDVNPTYLNVLLIRNVG